MEMNTNAIQIFRPCHAALNFNSKPRHAALNTIRIIERDGDPWWVAKDICDVLELGNITEATRGLDEDEKITLSNPDGNPRAGIPHTLNLINEPGLYSLILRSRKPEAKAFKRWIIHKACFKPHLLSG